MSGSRRPRGASPGKQFCLQGGWGRAYMGVGLRVYIENPLFGLSWILRDLGIHWDYMLAI